MHEAARIFDAAAWRLGHPRRKMNFQAEWTRQQAHDVTPPPRIITEEDRRCSRLQQRRLLVAEADERAMAEWRTCYP